MGIKLDLNQRYTKEIKSNKKLIFNKANIITEFYFLSIYKQKIIIS
jgi:hypothetical protein